MVKKFTFKDVKPTSPKPSRTGKNTGGVQGSRNLGEGGRGPQPLTVSTTVQPPKRPRDDGKKR
jgi:hypothetical protein